MTIAAASFTTDAARWAALSARDPRAEGRFFYSVRTTGVYCRPTCGARLPRRENVGFHVSPADAERAGFRACKRCDPRGDGPAERRARVIKRARARIEAAEAAVSLAELATDAGLSTFHFQRLFKQQVGMTPRQYAAALRLNTLDKALRAGRSVTEAMHQAGYSSSSRLYETSAGALGMAPAQLRRGAAGLEIQAAIRRCTLGRVLIAATARGVCLVAFGDDDETLHGELRRRFPRARITEAQRSFETLADRMASVIDADEIPRDIPLDLIGTAFQQRVWNALREIPRGETVTYAELARRIGVPRAVRAVGTACGANPVAVAVPCHRVLRGDGALGGYRWGLERKRALLRRETPTT